MSRLPTQPNHSLLEGIEVLLAVARSAEPVRVRPLARELGLTPTRLQRYLATLAHGGLLRQDSDRRYAPGPGMHALSAISLGASGLAPRAMEILPSLSGLNCIVALGILWRRKVSYLYFHTPDSRSARALAGGSDYPAEDSVVGHVLLAEWTDARVREAFPDCRASLCRDLATVRERGYARIDRPDGETGLAVALGRSTGAALALSGYFDRRTIPSLVRRLRETAERLEERGPDASEDAPPAAL